MTTIKIKIRRRRCLHFEHIGVLLKLKYEGEDILHFGHIVVLFKSVWSGQKYVTIKMGKKMEDHDNSKG